MEIVIPACCLTDYELQSSSNNVVLPMVSSIPFHEDKFTGRDKFLDNTHIPHNSIRVADLVKRVLVQSIRYVSITIKITIL
jgi:hypothetical protein